MNPWLRSTKPRLRGRIRDWSHLKNWLRVHAEGVRRSTRRTATTTVAPPNRCNRPKITK
ncbi:hypothetical protein J2W79_004436 [Methylorubrum extorquens]|nr:hypothetical protein [Methylorubrum extorquens]